MPTPAELATFARWLRKYYAPASVRKIRADVQTMGVWGPEPPEAKRLDVRLQNYRWAWSRWRKFCEAKGIRNTLAEPPRPERPMGRRPRRAKPALSIPEDQWGALCERFASDDSPAGAVLDVLCATGLRIGDVLRLNESTLAEAFARPDGAAVAYLKGDKPVIVSVAGARRAWEHLHAWLEPGQQVSDAVRPGSSAEAGSAAYQHVRRALKAHATEAGLDARKVHLHRTRRTVAVTLLRNGATLEEVQRALGQSSSKTTAGYVDEPMTDLVTNALRKINRDA